jgi:hypothetical protein
MPERWETVVEDIAQVVALVLDRAQDVADAVNDLVRTRPTLTKAMLAGLAGVVVGSFIAEKTRPRPPSLAEGSRRAAEVAARAAQAAAARAAVRAAARAQSAAGQAASAAQSAAGRVGERLPSREELRQRMPSRQDVEARIPSRTAERNGRGAPISPRSSPDANQLRYAAQLLPVLLALLRNPLVRDFLIRSAVRAARRRPA